MTTTVKVVALALLLLVHSASRLALAQPSDGAEPGALEEPEAPEALEEPEEPEEPEEDPFDGILEDLALSHLSGAQACARPAALGDRVYLEYAGIEHATGEVFAANTRVGQLALIVRLGEKQVLPAFQAGVLGACSGSTKRVEIPAHLNNLTDPRAAKDNRVEGMPTQVAVDFEFKVLDIVPKAAIKVTDALVVKMRMNHNVAAADVEAAVELGMPVDVMDTNSRTLLVTAAFTANTNAIRALLKLGADPNRAMHTGMTALIYAAGEGHDDIVAMLLGAGARTNAHLHIRGSALEGYTPLHFACLQGRANAAKLLLEYGADPEPRDGKGQTPLQVAKKIVDGGSHKGLKPRDRARTRKQFEAIQALVDEAITKKAHGAIAGGGEL